MLDGGAGNDREYSFDGNDIFRQLGSAPNGADVLSGGDGEDAAKYEHRRGGVSISLDGVANDGAAGEGDNVAPDVEKVFGGKGDDTIVGDAKRNFVYGLAGDDIIDVQDGIGKDVVDGGPGTDMCTADPGDTVSNCP